MEHPSSGRPFSDFRSRLSNRLLDARTLVLNEALTSNVAGQITEQLALLDAESDQPVQFLMSNAPGGEVDAGLSVYDFLRSISAPVTVLGSGRIVGAGVVAFVGVPASRRFGLPHVRFRFEEPQMSLDADAAEDLAEATRAAAERRKRVRTLLANATGQSEEQIEADVSNRRSFEAEAAAEYGLIDRVVQSRREIE